MALVGQQRSILPRVGTRKLHHLIKEQLAGAGLSLGRDGLFDLLREQSLLVARRKRYVQTTDSRGWMRQFKDLTKGLEVTACGQLWVSDITYLDTREGPLYLTLVTDAFSRRIMGHSVASTLEASSVAQALKEALKEGRPGEGLIHHSDRGNQYLSQTYRSICLEAGMRQSTTQDGNPYDNALAERMNRTLKEEFGLDQKLPSRSLAERLCGQAVQHYNTIRPHLALKMQTPDQVYKNSLTPLMESG